MHTGWKVQNKRYFLWAGIHLGKYVCNEIFIKAYYNQIKCDLLAVYEDTRVVSYIYA